MTLRVVGGNGSSELSESKRFTCTGNGDRWHCQEIIVSGDNDLRADDELRAAMETHSIQLLGVQSFLSYLNQGSW
ncbi:MAG: hypothetical protein WCA35_03195 [Kovacikia sp.]